VSNPPANSLLKLTLYSFPLSVVSLSVARVMQSIHSLAANLGTDAEWLLNNAELSRVPWRKGEREGEYIVELGAHDGDDSELRFDRSSGERRYSLQVTHIGVLEPTYPPPRF
jgi:hypothetical protein